MATIRCTNSESKSVSFMFNGGNPNDIMVAAMQDGEYWFTIGWYKTEKGAKRAAIKSMKKHGYLLNESEVMNLKLS